MYLIFYSIGRFLIEMLRNDPRGTAQYPLHLPVYFYFYTGSRNPDVRALPQGEKSVKKYKWQQ